MAVKEIKPEKPKSSSEIIGLIQTALKEARSEEYDSVIIIMRNDEHQWSDCVTNINADLMALVGALDDIKDRVKEVWRDLSDET